MLKVHWWVIYYSYFDLLRLVARKLKPWIPWNIEILKKSLPFPTVSSERSDTTWGERKLLMNELTPSYFTVFFLDASLLSYPHLTTTTLTPPMPQWDRMASRNSSGMVTELLSSIRLVTWDLTCAAFLSQAGSLPPCGSLKSTCLTHLWFSPTLFIFLDKVPLECLAKLSSDSNLHNLTANNRMPVFENKRLNLQDIWRWILKKCYL